MAENTKPANRSGGTELSDKDGCVLGQVYEDVSNSEFMNLTTKYIIQQSNDFDMEAAFGFVVFGDVEESKVIMRCYNFTTLAGFNSAMNRFPVSNERKWSPIRTDKHKWMTMSFPHNDTFWFIWVPKRCMVCKKADVGLHKCSQCLLGVYCSVECQKKDWAESHKLMCSVNRK